MKFISTAALVGVAAATDPTKTVVTTECAALNVKAFTDAKCATAAKEKADLTKATNYGTHWKDMEKCVAAGSDWTNTVCDGTGITTTLYSEKTCKTAKTGVKPTVVKWGECQTGGPLGSAGSFQVTGARHMMVGAAAALAFVASQF